MCIYNDNNFDKQDKQVVIKFEVPQIINKVASPLADSVGKTLSQLWEGMTMRIAEWHGRKKMEHDINLRLYKEAIQKEISKVPEENFQSPQMNIIGPAFVASEFYFEEKQYRDMFSKLIAGSFDNRNNNKIQPYFVEAIKQMTSKDAKLLALFKTNFTQPIARYNYVLRENNGEFTFKNNVFYPTAEYSEPEYYSASIENLVRLGFLNVDFTRAFTNDENYEVFYKDPVFIKSKGNTDLNIDNSLPYYAEDINLTKGIVKITSLGQSFIDICI